MAGGTIDGFERGYSHALRYVPYTQRSLRESPERPLVLLSVIAILAECFCTVEREIFRATCVMCLTVAMPSFTVRPRSLSEDLRA